MRPKSLKGLTYSQYANHRERLGLTGQTKQSVAAAVKSRRITALPDGSVDPERADVEWRARTDPGKQRLANGRRAPKAPRREDRKAESKPAGAEEAQHEARIQTLAAITSPSEVMRFAGDLVRMGISEAEACAAGQLHSIRAGLAVPDIGHEDFDERFRDPTADEWRRSLGDFDVSAADELVDRLMEDGL